LNKLANVKYSELKELITQTCNYRPYNATWGGVVDNKPVAADLEAFGHMVIEDLWSSICKVFPEESVSRDEVRHNYLFFLLFVS